MRLRKLAVGAVVPLVIASLAAGATAKPQRAPLKGVGKGLKLIANIPYAGGTDMEFATLKGRDYAFVGSAPGVGGAKTGDFRVIDVSNPTKPKVVAKLPCNFYQGDVQLSHDKKTALLAADSGVGPNTCFRGAVGKLGFVTIDISNPKKPKAVGFAQIDRGSHNVTAHPTKPIVWNSDSDLEKRGTIEIWSIANPAKPKKVGQVDSLPHSPHDVSFNAKGTLAVTAAVSHFDIWDTKDPTKPTLLYTGQCPGCSITHDAKFTPDGKRLVIGDEGGGGGTYWCPGGALYVYDLQMPGGRPAPVLTAVYEPQEFVMVAPTPRLPGACTSHVFDFSPDGKKISISWYTAGTRYLDIGTAQGLSVGENGNPGSIREIGWFIPEGAISWSSKIHKNGYIFSNDEHRGFDVYKIAAK